MDNIRNDFKGKDILSLDQFEPGSLEKLFKKTDDIVLSIKKNGYKNILKRKIVALLFFEPSSRTFGSFACAVKRLGGQTIEIQDAKNTSSFAKGESLEDMIKVFENYCDAIVMRHPEKGSAQKAAEAAVNVPIINAGDGIGEHPTQTFLDLYTIRQTFGRLNNLKGLIGGDLLNGRTVHSLIKGLSLYKNNSLYLLSPKSLRLRKAIFQECVQRQIKLLEINNEQEIPSGLHFWYWTRIQKERFKSPAEYEKVRNIFTITRRLIEEKGSSHMIVMHPLPRVGEIDSQVDLDKRSVYLSRQIQNGVYTRMALLVLLLGKL